MTGGGTPPPAVPGQDAGPALPAAVALQWEVEQLAVRYATGIDRKDWDLLATCFVPDVDADYGEVGHWRGRDELVAFLRTAHEGLGHTLHRISNVVAAATPTGASSRAYVDALVLADVRSGVRAAGWYDDELVRSEEHWRVARRVFTPVLLQPVEGVPLSLPPD